MIPFRSSTLLLLLVVVMTLVGAMPVSAQDLERTLESPRIVDVTDADTVTLEYGPEGERETNRVRFAGIDAPESDQPYGYQATAYMMDRIRASESLTVRVEKDTGRWERLVGVLYLDGASLNRWLVEQGHAWVYDHYNDDPRLPEVEKKARAEGRGLWSMDDPTPPWEWRQNH